MLYPGAMQSSPDSKQKLDGLLAVLGDMGSVLVCFSGGVDSAFVLAAARRALGARAVGLTTHSASVAPKEREDAATIARQVGAEHLVVESRELDDPRYAANPVNRCYYCKNELYAVAARVASERGIAVVLNGTNVDDLGDHRPGLDAAREAGVRSPLVELGYRKSDVREGARLLGLSVWDKPAAACLSSRIPYGTSVTAERLAQIDAAEQALRALGLRQVRVRFHEKLARVEVGTSELDAAFAMRARVIEACKSAGFRYVTLDLEGYRVGSHNEVLRLPVLRS